MDTTLFKCTSYGSGWFAIKIACTVKTLRIRKGFCITVWILLVFLSNCFQIGFSHIPGRLKKSEFILIHTFPHSLLISVKCFES